MMTENLPRGQLLKLIDIYAKAWQAMDSAYFLALENKYGIDIAIEMDKEAWKIFSPIEATRIMKEFQINPGGGLQSLEKALGYRVYAALNKQSTKLVNEKTLHFTMEECRVQVARKRKGLQDFPCKQVGNTEYSYFASTIDPRIKTQCVFCPPDSHPDDAYCSWEFTLEE
ncbi:MAG: DUF6125 family protein [Candidatus Odinarchaeota archaeon]